MSEQLLVDVIECEDSPLLRLDDVLTSLRFVTETIETLAVRHEDEGRADLIIPCRVLGQLVGFAEKARDDLFEESRARKAGAVK